MLHMLSIYDVPTSPGSLVLYFTSLCTSYPHYTPAFFVYTNPVRFFWHLEFPCIAPLHD